MCVLVRQSASWGNLTTSFVIWYPILFTLPQYIFPFHQQLHIIVHILLLIIVIIALQPFVGPWPLFQILYPIHSQWDSLDGRSSRRKASTNTQDNPNTEWTHTDNHASSGIRTHDLSVRAGEDRSCLTLRGHCDRPCCTSIYMIQKAIRHQYKCHNSGYFPTQLGPIDLSRSLDTRRLHLETETVSGFRNVVFWVKDRTMENAETESSLRNAVFWIRDRTMDNVKNCGSYTNIPSSQAYRHKYSIPVIIVLTVSSD
jgi:hypothetical protein